MTKRPNIRKTSEDDILRLTKNLWIEKGKQIKDKKSYDKAWKDYLGDTDANHLKPQVRDALMKIFPKLKLQPEEKEKIKKKMEKTRKKQGITKPIKWVRIPTPLHRKPDVIGRSGDKIVVGFKQQIIVRKRLKTIYRDRKGRFVKVLKNQGGI